MRAYLETLVKILHNGRVNRKLSKVADEDFLANRKKPDLNLILDTVSLISRDFQNSFQIQNIFLVYVSAHFWILISKWNFRGHARSHEVILGQIPPGSPPRK